MIDILDKLRGGRILVMGRAGLDLYPDPPGTKTRDAKGFTAGLGGSAGNIAAAIAKGGGAVSLLTCVSDDPVGDFTLARLADHGINATHVRRVTGGARTTLALAETVLDGHQSVLYRNGAADLEMTSEDVARVTFDRFAALVTAGTVLAVDPARTAAFAAFDAAQAAGCLRVFDIDYRPYSWASPEVAAEVLSRGGRAADVIVGNDEEFDFMAGGAGQGLALARGLAKAGKLVIYKRGPDGSTTLFSDTETPTPSFSVTALKPFGAGDAFLGTIIAALIKGLPLPDALRRGSAAAALVVSRVGCALNTPSPQEIELFIQRNA